MHTVHVTINENHTKYFLLRTFPCAECDAPIVATRESCSVHVRPVTYAAQEAKCPHCGASNIQLSAKTKDACAQLENIVAQMEGAKLVNKKVLELID